VLPGVSHFWEKIDNGAGPGQRIGQRINGLGTLCWQTHDIRHIEIASSGTHSPLA
jgi:hypothetical protein